jgi:hypothetical protein
MVTTAKLSMARTVIDFAPELSRHSIAQPYDTDLRRDLHRRRPHGHATILSTPAAIVVRPGVADTASGDVVISHRETKRCRRDEVGDTGGGRARGKSWWKPRAALIRKARRQRDRNAIVADLDRYISVRVAFVFGAREPQALTITRVSALPWDAPKHCFMASALTFWSS